MITPGAETSGLRPSSTDGPTALKSACTSEGTEVSPIGEMLNVADGLAITKSRSASPALRGTNMDGMCVFDTPMLISWSPPSEPSEISLLKMIPARAPAAAALLTLSAKAQTPRSINATLPVSDPAGRQAHARPPRHNQPNNKQQ